MLLYLKVVKRASVQNVVVRHRKKYPPPQKKKDSVRQLHLCSVLTFGFPDLA